MELATKQDLKELEQSLSYKIELLRADTATAIERSQNKLIFWMGGIVTVGVSVILWFIENYGKI